MNRNEKALIRLVDVQLLLRDGYSKAEIARRLDVTYETVRRHINDWKNDPSMLRLLAIRESVLWVGIQVERRNLQLLDGQLKVDQILDLLKEDIING